MEELLIKYFCKETTEEENKEILYNLRHDSAFKEEFLKFEKEFFEINKSLKQVDVDEALFGIQKQIYGKRTNSILYKVIKVAAILLLGVMIGGITTIIYNNNKPVQYCELMTSKGERTHLMLSDSTKVWLAPESSIRFPEKFGKKREVKVSGQVYFNVAKDKKRPFIVSTENFNVRVLGTTFNISAYKDDAFQSVTLRTGSVELTDLFSHKIFKMVPNDKVSFDCKNRKLEFSKVDANSCTLWKDNIYYFNNDNLANICKNLERWYNLKINFRNLDAKNIHFKGTFENKNIDEIISIIATVGDLKYQIANNEITIYK